MYHKQCNNKIKMNCFMVLYILLLWNLEAECQPSDAPPVDQLRPEADRTCVPGFVCQHGYCNKTNLSTLQCVCDAGWIGPFCERSCPIDCGPHGACSVLNGEPACVCTWQYTGILCDRPIIGVNPTTVQSPPTTLNPNTDIDIQPFLDLLSTPNTVTTTNLPLDDTATPNDVIADAPSEPSTQLPLEAVTTLTVTKQCFPGFVCQNGYCKTGELKCICDQDWTGPFCEKQCPLKCGDFGECESFANGTYYCKCVEGFAGVPCTQSQAIQTTTEGETSTGSIKAPSTASTQGTIGKWTLNQRSCASHFVCVNGYCSKSPGTFSCICDKDWTGFYCEKHCPANCKQSEVCKIFSNGTTYCRCNGSQCRLTDPNHGQIKGAADDEAQWYWYVIGSCICLLVLLVLIMIIVPYLLWRKRDIFMMKIVHAFQPYEDKDGKLFDVFISYKSTDTDEAFVLRQLFPKLEADNNMKVCLHFRDFNPENSLCSNLVWAVENSRRTIMIFTPEYVTSEFCKYEYQRAQQELLKQKPRIIPIILEDVSQHLNYMDDTLKTLVTSTSHLTWPGGDDKKEVVKFWRRLELSLPKRRQQREIIKKTGSQKSKKESVRLRRFSKDVSPGSTFSNSSDFVRLSIDEESMRNGRDNHGFRGSSTTISVIS